MTETKKHWLFEKKYMFSLNLIPPLNVPKTVKAVKKKITWWNTL